MQGKTGRGKGRLIPEDGVMMQGKAGRGKDSGEVSDRHKPPAGFQPQSGHRGPWGWQSLRGSQVAGSVVSVRTSRLGTSSAG